tara:strand:- start:878 stop:1474 length:597 start_codon:yes stop_codon:yes gene_type:complete
MRARLALRLCKIQCIIREISLKAKNSEFLKVSPKATVPVLVLPNGEVLEESLGIIYWSLEQNDPSKLKINNQLANKTNKLIELFDTEFKFHLDRYKYSSRYNIKNSQVHRDKARDILVQINIMLEGNNYIGGNNISLLDISILPFVRQFRIADKEWFDDNLGLENINNWLNTFLNSDLLSSIMTKYKVWEIDDPVTLF